MAEVLCGFHAVREALVSGKPLERILIARDLGSVRGQEVAAEAARLGVPVRQEVRERLDRLAGGQVHQGIVAIGAAAKGARLEDLTVRDDAVIVMLDGVEDPQNLGAVIRSAESAGAAGVVVPDRHSAPLSAAAVKASAGAASHLPLVRVGNLVRTIDELKRQRFWIVGVDASGEQLWTGFDYRGRVALVFGGEHRGIRRLVREHCDVCVRLPMLGRIGSLNVSVAAGVVLYEVVRQRGGDRHSAPPAPGSPGSPRK